MTPMDVFRAEMKIAGFALCVCEGGYDRFGCDIVSRVVYFGADVPEVQAGIVGLHELGHWHLLDEASKNFDRNAAEGWSLERLINSTFSLIPGYPNELMAWVWAESKMPPGYEAEFQDMRAYGLSSYRPPEAV